MYDIESEKKFVRQNTAYYKRCFDDMYKYNTKFSWNWGAFFFPMCWCFYRKMYTVGAVNFAVGILAYATNVFWRIYVCQMIIMGLFASNIYRCHVLEELDFYENDESYTSDSLEDFCRLKGGTSFALAFLAFLVFYGLTAVM